MSLSKYKYLLFSVLGMLLLAACSKSDEGFTTTPASAYEPLSIGKYFVYQCDSTQYNYSNTGVTSNYQLKDVVAAEVSDLLGRPSFRIDRYIRYSTTANWQFIYAYGISTNEKYVDVFDYNNFRIQSLKYPVSAGLTWKGNSYLPESPFENYFTFSVDRDMNQWVFDYTDVNVKATVQGTQYDSVVTVLQADYGDNLNAQGKPESDTAFATRSYSVEKYAKNIGLIYKEFILWEFQPIRIGFPNSFTNGFSFKMELIEHN